MSNIEWLNDLATKYNLNVDRRVMRIRSIPNRELELINNLGVIIYLDSDGDYSMSSYSTTTKLYTYRKLNKPGIELWNSLANKELEKIINKEKLAKFLGE